MTSGRVHSLPSTLPSKPFGGIMGSMRFMSSILFALVVMLGPAVSGDPMVVPLVYAQADSADIGSDKAVEIARKQASGRVLDVQRKGATGSAAYEVKILQDDGHVKTIKIGAQDGATL